MTKQSNIEISNIEDGLAKVTVDGEWVGNLCRYRNSCRPLPGNIDISYYFSRVSERGYAIGNPVLFGAGMTACEARARCIAYLRSL